VEEKGRVELARVVGKNRREAVSTVYIGQGLSASIGKERGNHTGLEATTARGDQRWGRQQRRGDVALARRDAGAGEADRWFGPYAQ
jgi:hypothetical protein